MNLITKFGDDGPNLILPFARQLYILTFGYLLNFSSCFPMQFGIQCLCHKHCLLIP